MQETINLIKFVQNEIMPYYELYELVLDDQPKFSFECQEYQPVPTASEPRIFEGEVCNVENVEVLKDFLGERAPKEEKKDPKKK